MTPGITPAANGRYRARFSAQGERAYLGTFDTLELAEAALETARAAYQKAMGLRAPLRKDNTSGTPGVYWNRKDRRWIARRRGVYLGSFREKGDAIAAVNGGVLIEKAKLKT